MPYKTGTQVDPAVFAEEAKLLRAGFSYTEIAAMTGPRIKTVSERNRIIHKVDIWQAFGDRIARDGVPDRTIASSEFSQWFVGFFDGEGSFVVFTRPASRYAEYRLAVRCS